MLGAERRERIGRGQALDVVISFQRFVALSAVVLLGTRLAWGQPESASSGSGSDQASVSAAAEPEAVSSKPPLRLAYLSAVPSPTADEVIAAVSAELGVAVELATGPADLTVQLGDNGILIRFAPEGRDPVERLVPQPSEPAEIVPTISLLAGNLARDAAGELLSSFRPKPPPEATETEVPPVEPLAEAVPTAPPLPPPPPPPEPEVVPPTKNSIAPEPRRAQLQPGYFGLALVPGVTLPAAFPRRQFFATAALAWQDPGRVDGLAVSAVGQHLVHGGSGLAVATVVSTVGGPFRGLLVASVWTSHSVEFRGIQASLIAAGSSDARFLGIQVGLVSVAGHMTGVQAGLVAANRTLRGAQFCLVCATQELQGGQVGLVNVARKAGFQAGLVNVGGDGFQLGLVNIAPKSSRGALGLINIVPSVRNQLVVWGSGSLGLWPGLGPSSALVQAGWRVLWPHFYFMVHAGYGAGGVQGGRLAAGGTVGARIRSAPVAVDFDYQFATEGALSQMDIWWISRARAAVSWQAWRSAALFLGLGPEVALPGKLDGTVPAWTRTTVSAHLFGGISFF